MTKISVSTKVYASLQQVRTSRNTNQTKRYFASPERHCPQASNDLTIGGIINIRMEAKDGSFGFDMIGQYTHIEPMSEIIYKLGEIKDNFIDSGREVVTQFLEDGSCGCVSVTQTFDAEKNSPLELQQQGRQAILDNFKTVCESQTE